MGPTGLGEAGEVAASDLSVVIAGRWLGLPLPSMAVAPSIDDLARLELQVRDALASHDYSALSIVGFGEISVGLGWPTGEPSWVCKRTPPFTTVAYEAYRELVTSYVAELRAAGVAVVDTDVVGVRRADDTIGYLVQPLLPKDTLGREVLARSAPDANHRYVRAIVETMHCVSNRISIDAQVTNFAWDGHQATLLDVGTPFMWNADGSMRLDLEPFAAMLPAPARRMMRSELTDVVERWKSPRAVGTDIVANLLREGLGEWVDPMIEALSTAIPGEPISRADAQASLAEDLKTFPKIVKLKKVQRAFRTRVQRKPYDFFINSTYDGDSLS